MSIRVYSLAKQLQKDNTVIIDACNKLGIKNKNRNSKAGSEGGLVALSTLSDEDVEKIKDFLEREDTEKKSSTFRSLIEPKNGATLEQPKSSRASSGKIRRIRPARGRITEVDPNTRAAVPSTSETSAESSERGAGGRAQSSQDANVAKAGEIVVDTSVSEELKPGSDEQKRIETPTISTVAKEANSIPNAAEPKVETDVAEDGESERFVSVSSDEANKAPRLESINERAELKVDIPKVEESLTETPAQSEAPERDIPSQGAESTGVARSDNAKKPEIQDKSESSVHKSPLRQALDSRNSGREGQRRVRERDSKTKNDARRGGRVGETRTTRPTAVSSSFIAQLESRAQVLDEMKRPPMITTQANDRVRVLGSSSGRTKTEGNGSQGGTGNRSSKLGFNLHLAPMPAEPARITKKAEKEPVAQKPEKRLPPEALRAASSGAGLGPLSGRLRAQKEAGPSGGSASAGRGERRSQESGGGTRSSVRDRQGRAVFPGRGDSGFGMNQGSSSDFGAGRRSKKSAGARDRDDSEGREDARGGSRRRQNNESRRFRNGDDDSYDFRISSRVGGRSGNREKSTSGAGAGTAPRKNDVVIETPCTVRQFAETTGLSVPVVIKKLMELGYMVNLNQALDTDVLELLIVAFELKATIKEETSLEEQYVDSAYDIVDPPESLKPRAPVVTFLGHVDHGKTSLLDRILHLHVVQGEKGGITQHIRAYRVETPGGPVTFVDTPGHEAFTEMRARGANVTDVAVLVVAADDGVMPQTEEAISHAKAAGVPIVVALNKMDLPGVNRDKVIQELASNDLMPSEWGGDVEVVETSAVTGMGVDNLLETLLMVAELHELKANPNRPALGVVLEASLKSGEGVVCSALVQKGTLRPGDVVLCGASYGRVRSMTDTLNRRKRIKEAGPGVPVFMTGLDVAPEAGSRFVVLDDVAVARQIAEDRAKRAHEVELAGAPSHVTLENLFERINSAKTQQTLNVIIRADVRGSIEAIRKELGKLEHPEVKVKILQASVGGITEADVHLADASDAIIVGFNVVPDEGARNLAEAKKVQIRRYDVIYKLTEDIRAALEGMLKPVEQVKELGRALVQRTFNISHVGVIAGCRVLYGVVERDCQIRVIRDSRVIGEYKLETLRREKDDAREVREGYECGIKLKNYNDVKEGDVLEAYKIEEVARTL